jgi:hypothetical protein
VAITPVEKSENFREIDDDDKNRQKQNRSRKYGKLYNDNMNPRPSPINS